MSDARLLTKIIYGSHLFGTNTVNSDNDFKSVYLPSEADILLGRSFQVQEFRSKEDISVKNTKNDIDDSSYSIAKFLKLIVDGDTSATEILLAPKEFRLVDSPEFNQIVSYKDRLLNRKSKGFVGYCRTQAAKYGLKGSRLKVARETIEFLNSLVAVTSFNTKLYHFSDQIHAFALQTEHASIDKLTTPNGTQLAHLNVLDRKAPFTITLGAAIDIYTKIAENYGLRAKQAAENANVDWKAVSHAVRVGEQAIELLSTGNLTFPRPNAEYLLKIKKGELPYEQVGEDLETLLTLAEEAAANSVLPETSDETLVENLIMHYHKTQVLNGD